MNFFYRDVTDFNQVPPTPLICHHGESRKMCRPTYPQGVTQLLNRAKRKVCQGFEFQVLTNSLQVLAI